MVDAIQLGMLTASCPRTENTGLEEMTPNNDFSFWLPMGVAVAILFVSTFIGLITIWMVM